MINILIKSEGDIKVEGDITMFIRRKLSITSRISLEFFTDTNEAFLKAHYFSLSLFGKLHIDYQNLEEQLAFDDYLSRLTAGRLEMRIQHKWHYWITGRLCSVYCNGRKIADVRCRNRFSGIILVINDTIEDREELMYLVILLVVKYSDLDGGD